MKFSQRIQRVKPSMTLDISVMAQELKAQGQDVIGFGAGEPDFDTPQNIKQAGIDAIQNNDTHYTPVGGTEALKEAILHKFKRDNGLVYRKDQIVVSCGAKHSFFNLAQALWEEGDEVIIPAPYWVSYPEIVRFAGALPVLVPTTAEEQFKVTPQQLQEVVTPRSRALILNSPCNPTGAAYTQKELEDLAEWALKNRILIVSDEIYEKITFDEFQHTSVASFSPEAQKNCVVINGVSKSYAMTGWRIGFLAAEREIAAQITKLQGQSTSNPTSISQAACIEALTGPQDQVTRMAEEFRKRRDIVIQRISRIPGLSCFRPVGAFYAFPDFSGFYGKTFQGQPLQGSIELNKFLLREGQVALVPGAAFGADGHSRLSFATSVENIGKGLDRIAEALNKLQ
ncbi:MAG: pyridoxal phosphate-dependent aminotransferase [Nitrospinaceae bacterium]